MEGEGNTDQQGSGSSSRSPTIAQRFSRQISRTVLPALRNLVRSNRSPQQRATRQDSNTSIPQPNSSQPIPIPETSQSVNSPLTEQPNIFTNVHEPPLSPLSPHSPLPPLPSSPLLEESLSPIEPPEPQETEDVDSLPNLIDDNDSTTTNSSQLEDMDTSTTNTRQRYRLVVYFEERSPEEQATARYVAVIVGRLDELQFLLSSSNTTERGFGDILNNLFNAYAPKGTPPAAPSIIDTLPTVTITEHEQSCMICLENFAEGSEAVVLPCKHTFHGEECVKSWLKLHNSCPICRYELPVEDPEYESERKERMIARGFNEDIHDHTHEDDDVDMGLCGHESGDAEMSGDECDNVGFLFGDGDAAN